jgi:alpha-mannosidase
MGFALYRVVQREPKVTEAEPKVSIEVGQTAVILENAYLKALFDPNDGALCALIDKTTGYDALHGRTQWRLWQDQRDTWGHLQGLPFRDTGTCYCVQRFEVIEQGPLRCGLHIELSHESSRLEQYYFLTHDSAHLVVEHVLDWDKPWHLLQWTLPIAASLPRVRAETAYGVLDRCPTSGQEYFMQRWLDVADSLTGKGLIVAGSDTQAFTYSDNTLGLIALRSPVMAQMNSPGWNEGAQQLRFSNLGHHRFHVALHPHGSRQPNHVGYRLADEVATVCTYLHTDNHHGRSDASRWSMAFSDQANVRPVLMKKAECGNDVVVRLFETDGRACSGTLQLLGHAYYFSIQAYGLATIKIDSINQRSCMVNGLEEPVDGQENDSWQKKER